MRGRGSRRFDLQRGRPRQSIGRRGDLAKGLRRRHLDLRQSRRRTSPRRPMADVRSTKITAYYTIVMYITGDVAWLGERTRNWRLRVGGRGQRKSGGVTEKDTHVIEMIAGRPLVRGRKTGFGNGARPLPSLKHKRSSLRPVRSTRSGRSPRSWRRFRPNSHRARARSGPCRSAHACRS